MTHFQHLFTFLGNTLSKNHSYLWQRADWLNEVTVSVIELAEERMVEVSDLQQCQNLLFKMLIKITTDGMPKLDSQLEGSEMIRAWDELMEKEREAMEVVQENRRALLRWMKQRLDQFKKTPDVGNEDYDWEAEEGIQQLAKETRNALCM